jgi:hypothetical protein
LFSRRLGRRSGNPIADQRVAEHAAKLILQAVIIPSEPDRSNDHDAATELLA